MSKEKKLLFSITAKDCIFETFCTGGAGGQHRNAKQNGVRCRHIASGAVAEHRDGRDQRKNKEAAFEKMAGTKEFKKWHKAEVARILGNVERLSAFETNEQVKARIEQRVAEQMSAANLRVEEYDSLSNPPM